MELQFILIYYRGCTRGHVCTHTYIHVKSIKNITTNIYFITFLIIIIIDTVSLYMYTTCTQ